jgi:hypothetical protein
MCKRKARRVFTSAFALTHEVKAKAAPNLENRKWLNFQDKIDRKLKVSKQAMLKMLKLSKLSKGIGMATIDWKVSRDSWTSIGSRTLVWEPIFLAICGQNSGVPFIAGCRDPRVT